MKMRTDLQSWINQAVERLQGISETPLLECHALTSHTLSKPREWIIAHPETELTEEQLVLLESQIQHLQVGKPLPYLTGIQAFYGLDFEVNADVLIPRPETELLVEEAVNWLQMHPGRRNALDMGTGSGAIAVAMADQVSDLRMMAADISPQALSIARQNAEKFRVADRISFVQSDLFENIAPGFDLIAANLPYIPSETLKNLPVERFEPHLALDGGADGLDLIRRFMVQAPGYLRPGGLLLMEIESGQSEAVIALAQNTLAEGLIKLVKDYAGLPRLIFIQAG